MAAHDNIHHNKTIEKHTLERIKGGEIPP